MRFPFTEIVSTRLNPPYTLHEKRSLPFGRRLPSQGPV